MTDQEKVTRFLSSATHMVLAVVLADGTPWAVPVRIKHWEANEFQWDSMLDTLHSRALSENPDVAVTIFQKRDDSQIGICMTGNASLLEENAEGKGRYRFRANTMWLNDETFVKREVELEDKTV